MNKEKRRVPKLRFPGFTEDWEQRKLGECMNSFAYGLNAAAKDYDGMHKYIRITDIDDETHNFIQSNLTSPDIDFNMDVSDYKLNVGDIVFARTGASVGKTYLYNPNDGDLYYAGFLIRGEVKEDCDAGFIYQNTLTKEYDSFIRITSQRSGQPGVNSKEYATFKLNIPCKDEQEKISKVLNSLDELYTLHQRKLEHLILKKKALLQKLFPKNGERYPELRFSEFTDAWEQRKLGDLAEIVRGASPRPISDPKWFDNNSNVGWLRIADVTAQDGRIRYLEQKISELGQEKTRVIKTPHLLLSIAATVGKPVINYVPTGVHDGFLIFLNPKSNILYTFWWLEMFREKWNKYGQPGSQVNLNSDLVKNQVINIPNEKEQEKISSFLEALDKIITLHQRKLEHLQLQKKALLQQMFV